MKRHIFSKFFLHPSWVTIFLIFSSLTAVSSQEKHSGLNKNLEILAQVLQELEAHYVEELDYETLLQTGIHKMLQSLDPYTCLITEEALPGFKTLITGAYAGIGALIGTRQNKHRIIMLYKDAPASKAGLRVGDIIIEVDGKQVQNQPIDQVSQSLKGLPKTSVQVTILREGITKPIVITIKREKVSLKSVTYAGSLQGNIGYIKLASFTTQAAEEVKTALQALKASGTQKLILDLRGNPGGILEEAVKIANIFLEQDLVIVNTKSKIGSLSAVYATQEPAYDSQMPLVVLIDQESASAAEIVAGVIQDYDRGILIGKKTYGKGLVQTIRPLCHNTQLKLTTAKYYIPSGRSIQKTQHKQKQPDTKLSLEPTTEPTVTFQTKHGRLVYEGNGIAPDQEIEKQQLAPITKSLLTQGLIFDYTFLFGAQHPSIGPAKSFQLSTAQYQSFIAWLADKEYAYSIESYFDQLCTKAQKEVYPEEIYQQLVLLRAKVQAYKQVDLEQHSKEIKLILQESILAHYYFQEEVIEAMLSHDQVIQQACRLLEDKSQYQSLLWPSLKMARLAYPY